MPLLERITANPEIMGGQACIRGTRLTVRRVIEAVALSRPGRTESRISRKREEKTMSEDLNEHHASTEPCTESKLLALHTSTVCLARALVLSGALDRAVFQSIG